MEAQHVRSYNHFISSPATPGVGPHCLSEGVTVAEAAGAGRMWRRGGEDNGEHIIKREIQFWCDEKSRTF